MLQLNFTLHGEAKIALDEARVSNGYDILCYIFGLDIESYKNILW